MSRLAERFNGVRAAGRSALIPYVTAGDPDPETTVPLMHALVRAGADVIELGVPFSDPMADGPVIQAAHERALGGGTGLKQVLEMVRAFRADDATTPVVLMGYLNPVERMGYGAFAEAAADAGVDGVLTVDMPPEEGEAAVQAFRRGGIDPIFLLAPNSGEARIEGVCRMASGFIYYVSLKGVTGSAGPDVAEVGERLAAIRAHTRLPVGVGFGISTPEAAAQVAQVADAVVVGSALVRLIAERTSDPEDATEAVAGLVKDMKKAMGART